MIYFTAPFRKLRPLTRSIALNSRKVQDKYTIDFISKSGGFAKRGLWSNSISFSSPESDFTSQILRDSPQVQTQPRINEESESNDLWSNSISYSSPESDFTSSATQSRAYEIVESTRNGEWSNQLSFSSPESDFTMNKEDFKNASPLKADFIDHLPNSHHYRDSMAYSLSFAGSESEFCSSQFMTLVDERMKRQLDNVSSKQQLQKRQEDSNIATTTDHLFEVELQEQAPLPSTYACATAPGDSRAIVVTEASSPFRIVSVNAAWEQLCGFSAAECHGKTLECLQGPETDREAVSALMSQLQKGREAGTVLTNYTKDGRKFRNELRVGPLMSDDDKLAHVVGVLTEIMDTEKQFGNSVQKINKMNA